MSAHDIKQLQVRKSKILSEITSNTNEITRISTANNSLKKTLSCIEKKLESKSNKVKVTEHALLRYLERRADIDLLELSEKITEAVMPMNGKYPIGDGLRAVVKDGCVVTVEK